MIKRGKKSQSNIIVIILIILIILVLLVILWNIVMGLIKQNQRTIDVQQRIARTQIIIDGRPPESEWTNPTGPGGYINLTVTRGREELTLESETTTQVELNAKADIVSLVDISGSMALPVTSACYGAYQDPLTGDTTDRDTYCVGNNAYDYSKPSGERDGAFCCYQDDPSDDSTQIDCLTQAGCNRVNNGQWVPDPDKSGEMICKFGSVFPPSCYKTDGTKYDPNTPAGCAECAKSSRAEWIHKCNFYDTLPANPAPYDDLYVEVWCAGDKKRCEYQCDGIWNVDLGEIQKGYCLPKTTPGSCCDLNDCTTQAGCSACFSEKVKTPPDLDGNKFSAYWKDGECRLWQYENSCCNDGTRNCQSVEADCNFCSETKPDGSIVNGIISDQGCKYHGLSKLSLITNYPCAKADREITGGFGQDYDICKSKKWYCRGEYRAERRIDLAKEANINFVKSVFTSSTENRIAIINFSDTSTTNPTADFYESTQLNNIENVINPWITSSAELENLNFSLDFVALDAQKTNLCKGFEDAINKIKEGIPLPPATDNKYRAIVLMTDGKSNIDCLGIEQDIEDPAIAETIRVELINLANNAHDNFKIHTYTIGISLNADTDLLSRMADPDTGGNGTFVASGDPNDLSSLYDQIAFKIQQDTIRIYSAENKWDFVRSIVTGTDTSGNANSICTSEITTIPLPLETKKIEVPTCSFTDLTKIELYLVAHTEDGREVIKLLDRIER